MAGLACLLALAPEQALGLQFARAAPVNGGPAVRLAGVAEAGVAQRQAPQLAVPAGERRGELTVARVPRNGPQRAARGLRAGAVGQLAQARTTPLPPPAHTEREGAHPAPS